jgi:hypothetical protein
MKFFTAQATAGVSTTKADVEATVTSSTHKEVEPELAGRPGVTPPDLSVDNESPGSAKQDQASTSRTHASEKTTGG